ncbi:hypothetical protein ACO1O0_000227 [Amphichorda felina]
MGQQPSGSGLTFSDFHTFVSEPKESQTRPNSPNRPLMQDHSGMKNYVVGNQIGDHRFEWDSPRSTRQRKTTGSKIAKRGKKAQFPDLVEPLSEWAKANGVKPKDVHGFATRDIEKRIAQAIKNGYVKRNLNVFFLYKRAYGAVAQSWMEMHHPTLAKTQPPLVTLVGESWAKESKEFKQSYTFYSELEKDGLRSAFPHYKYKPGAKKGQLGVTAVAEESHGASAEDSHRHKRDESRAGFSGPGQQAYRESSMGPPDQDGSLVQAQANENVHMSRLPANLRAQPLFAPQDPHYGPGSWSGSPEPVSILGGYGNSFLYPGRPEWQTGFRGGGPRMAWIPRLVTFAGLVLLAHAGYSAQEHAVLSATVAQHSLPTHLSSKSLPLDICIETITATLVVCLGLVMGSPKLRPIRWDVWAGKIEREGADGFRDGAGEVGKDFRGNPFGVLEVRPGFVDIRKQRREFTEWAKGQSK